MKTAPLSQTQIESALSTRLLGRRLHVYDSIGSTNVEAKRFAAAGAPDGTLVIADEQTAGKGRRGRHWVAPPRTCLLFSLIFRPALLPRQAAQLTMLCSLAAAEVIERETSLSVAIKWPNDIVIPGPPENRHQIRKLGGILTETALIGEQLAYAIVGMGINVNVDPAALGPVTSPATSLLAELGRPVDRVRLLAAILEGIEDHYPSLTNEEAHTRWAERLVTLGRPVVVSQGGPDPSSLEGVAEGVDPDGGLLLRDLAGNLHLISVGDVTLRAPSD